MDHSDRGTHRLKLKSEAGIFEDQFLILAVFSPSRAECGENNCVVGKINFSTHPFSSFHSIQLAEQEQTKKSP
jgi:hypothetical protein